MRRPRKSYSRRFISIINVHKVCHTLDLDLLFDPVWWWCEMLRCTINFTCKLSTFNGRWRRPSERLFERRNHILKNEVLQWHCRPELFPTVDLGLGVLVCLFLSSTTRHISATLGQLIQCVPSKQDKTKCHAFEAQFICSNSHTFNWSCLDVLLRLQLKSHYIMASVFCYSTTTHGTWR